MKLKSDQYSEHFWAQEFDYIEPEKILLTVLECLRTKTKDSIIITDAGRTPERHVAVYKELEKKGKLGNKKWYEAIPWRSRHLPVFGKKLRAVDLKAVKTRNDKGVIIDYYSGDEIYKFLKEVEDDIRIFLGVGVGSEYCHVDIDRQKPTVWYYS